MNTLAGTIAAAMGFASGRVAAAVGTGVAIRALMYEANAIAGDGPLLLSSPWPIPLMLAPTAAQDPRDDRISYTTFRDPVTKFYGAHVTNARPTFATLSSDLYMFHRGGGSNQNISYMKYEPKYGWGDSKQIPGATSAVDVGACEYNGQLHVVHHGYGSDASIYHIRLWNGNWTTDQVMRGMYSASGPALAAFRGRLYSE
ncbi:hypothetical protein F5Y14DRAFT_241476 [Nemania sp. NC0429]|nr:hypothetical protein F5Y14DRAFT_241476 [Nemania sp. NC0429]